MTRKLIATAVLVGVCIAVGLYTLNFARSKYQRPGSPQTTQTVPYTQPITSCAKGVRVVTAEVTDAGTPNAMIEVQIENLSNLGIVAVSLEATKGSESYTTTLRSSFNEDKPIVVIKPYETGVLTMSLFFGDVPLRVGGVFYEDGTEEGCASSLKTLHELKGSDKSKKESSHETSPHSLDPSPR